MQDAAAPFSDDGHSDEDLRVATLRLSLVSGIGPRLFHALLDRFETAAEVLAAAPSELQSVEGIGPKLARAIGRAGDIDVAAELQLCQEHGIAISSRTDDDYPQRLREIPDPPMILYRRGEILPQDGLAIAIVGSRHATTYGKFAAERFAGGLARAGLTIISGLARGIDGAAHRAALDAGGRTIAVLGSGLLELYPPEHAELAVEVAQHGAVLSECPPRMQPMAGMFPQRNRIVTGLSLGVIVIEASGTSGALISARHAKEQNRDVFAVPGRIDSRNSKGCHALIRDGAKLIESVDDVLEELGPLPVPAPREEGPPLHHPAELSLNDVETQILHAIDPDPTPIDALVGRTSLPIHRILATLSVLETKRLIRKISGNLVARV